MARVIFNCSAIAASLPGRPCECTRDIDRALKFAVSLILIGAGRNRVYEYHSSWRPYSLSNLESLNMYLFGTTKKILPAARNVKDDVISDIFIALCRNAVSTNVRFFALHDLDAVLLQV